MFSQTNNTHSADLPKESKQEYFERVMMPHLNAAYNLARWMTRNEHDAEDVVQEAYLRAFTAVDGFRSDSNGRAWILAIVRNTCLTWLQRNRPKEVVTAANEDLDMKADASLNPEQTLILMTRSDLFKKALGELPLRYREILILREIEELSYTAIAQVADIPLGTVMSRLARARQQLQYHVLGMASKEVRR
jgi:RNA polymerase sigma-70 factor (ECF subfamily)